MPRTGLTPKEIKERAVTAAEARIRSQGVDKVRLVDIARDLSVSHAALYKHFPDKAALIEAVTERWLDALDAELERVAGGPEPIEERLRAWFVAYHRLKRDKVRRDPEPYRAFDQAAEAMKPSIVAHLANVERQIVGLVAEAMGSGLIRKGDPKGTAALMLEATVGFHHPKLVAERLEEEREAALVSLLDALTKGLA